MALGEFWRSENLMFEKNSSDGAPRFFLSPLRGS